MNWHPEKNTWIKYVIGRGAEFYVNTHNPNLPSRLEKQDNRVVVLPIAFKKEENRCHKYEFTEMEEEPIEFGQKPDDDNESSKKKVDQVVVSLRNLWLGALTGNIRGTFIHYTIKTYLINHWPRHSPELWFGCIKDSLTAKTKDLFPQSWSDVTNLFNIFLIVMESLKGQVIVAVEKKEDDIKPDVVLSNGEGLPVTRLDWKTGKVDFREIKIKHEKYLKSSPNLVFVYLDIGLVLRILDKKLSIERYWTDWDSLYHGGWKFERDIAS